MKMHYNVPRGACSVLDKAKFTLSKFSSKATFYNCNRTLFLWNDERKGV